MRPVLGHAWLNLWDKHMATGRINQITDGDFTCHELAKKHTSMLIKQTHTRFSYFTSEFLFKRSNDHQTTDRIYHSARMTGMQHSVRKNSHFSSRSGKETQTYYKSCTEEAFRSLTKSSRITAKPSALSLSKREWKKVQWVIATWLSRDATRRATRHSRDFSFFLPLWQREKKSLRL